MKQKSKEKQTIINNFSQHLKTEIKKNYKKLKFMDKTHLRYFVVCTFISAFCLFTGMTYSIFNFSKYLEAAVVTIAKLKYALTSTNTNFIDNSISIEPGKTLLLNLDLKSLNSQNTKYALDAQSTSEEVSISYVTNREQNVQGEIAGLNSIITIAIALKNKSTESQTVTFDLKGGYLQNTLESNITEKYVPTIMAVTEDYKENMWSQKENIQTITLEDTLEPKADAAYTYDISNEQDGSIMSYLIPTAEDETLYDAYIQSNGRLATNEDSSYLFSNFTKLTNIENLAILDTSNTIDMNHMFHNTFKLTSLDLSNFDTGNVTNMSNMFEYEITDISLDQGGDSLLESSPRELIPGTGAILPAENTPTSSLTEIKFSDKFVTSNVTDMSSMFRGCVKLAALDLSGFDTSKVTNMSSMFRGCASISILDLSNFDTNKVINMSHMFENFDTLVANGSDISDSDMTNSDIRNSGSELLDQNSLSSSDGLSSSTSTSTNSLTEIKFSDKFVTNNVTDMSYMFASNDGLTALDLSNFDTSNVTNMNDMFAGCSGLTTLNISNFNTSKVTNMSGIFGGCSKLTILNLNNFDTTNITNMSSMFAGCSNLTTLDLSAFDTSKVTDMSYMFTNCRSLTTLDLSAFDTNKVTDMRSMFANCVSLTTLDLSAFDTGKVTNMSRMFANSEMISYTSGGILGNSELLDQGSSSSERTSSVTSTSSLTEIKFSDKFVTNNVTDMSYMFALCSNLTTLDLSNFDTSKVTNMSRMFYKTIKLATLDLRSFDTSNVTNMNGMFSMIKITQNNNYLSMADSSSPELNRLNLSMLSLSQLNSSKYQLMRLNSSTSSIEPVSSLTEIKFSDKFKTGNVDDMAFMFAGCIELTALDLNNFDTSNIVNMEGMFYECSSITTLDLSNFDTSKVIKMDGNTSNNHGIFEGCTNLTSLNLSNWNIQNLIFSGKIFKSVPTDIIITVNSDAMQEWVISVSSDPELTESNINRV